MTQRKDSATATDWREIFGAGPDGLRHLVQQIVQEVLEAEMEEAVGAQKSERTAERVGYRSGYYTRTLVTRVGKLVLRVPQDR
jgi:putative transposase